MTSKYHIKMVLNIDNNIVLIKIEIIKTKTNGGLRLPAAQKVLPYGKSFCLVLDYRFLKTVL